MEISFDDKKLLKEVSDSSLLERRRGPKQAKLIRRRLDQLRAAGCLEDMRHLPGARCHELLHNRARQLSVDLDHPYRLILRPTASPVPVKPDGGMDWKNITAVTIIEITNTHE